MKHESVEITINGLKAQVITYSDGWERVIVLDRYDNITREEISWLISYLETEGFLFWKKPKVELVKPA